MSHYNINYAGTDTYDKIDIGFGEPGTNSDMVVSAFDRLDELCDYKKVGILKGGKLILVNGAASLPVACVIGHKLAHLYGAVAIFDPKLQGYVVSISHSPDWSLGMLIKEEWLNSPEWVNGRL